MKKLIIIDHEPLTTRRRQIFYIDELKAKGIDVEFWDCSQYFHPSMKLVDMLDVSYLRKFVSLSQIDDALTNEKIDNTIFVVEVFELWQNHKFFALLRKYSITAVRMWMYSTAILGGEKMINRLKFTRILRAIKGRTLNLLLKLYFKRNDIVAYPKLITTDRRSDAVLTLNHPDWEQYKTALNLPLEFSDKKYIVFLDEYFALHPDTKHLSGEDYSKYAVSYHKDLNDFFDRLEAQTSMEVIIAAHPKAQYEPSVFNNRQIIWGKTNSLVKESQGVVMHRSASVAYPIMFNKPLLITTSNQMEQIGPIKTHFKQLSYLLGKSVYNLSLKTTEPIEFLPLDADKREHYIYTFLTTPQIQDQDNATMLFNYFSRL